MSFITSLIVTIGLTPLSKKLAFFLGAIDKPNDRRINSKPVPSIGGIAIYGGFLISVLLFSSLSRGLVGILLGGTFIIFVGVIDDLCEISPVVKLLGQVGAAIILIAFGIEVQFITNPFGGLFYLGVWSIPFTILWIVGITNTVNLVDGLDGLASGVSAIAAITLFLVGLQEGQIFAAILALSLAGSSLGFLKFNFYPAEIFMGDVGAMFLGYLLAAISITGALKSAAAVTLIVPVLALGIPIFDTIFAIIRRLYNKRPISKADNGHIHHRLLALGWNQAEAVLIVYGISIFLGLMALIINGSNFQHAVILLILIIGSLIYGAWRIGIFSVDLPAEGSRLEKTRL